MSPNLTPRRAVADAGLPAAGNTYRRYPIQFDLRYKVLRGGTPLRGLGRTHEVSSADLRFAADQRLRPGAEVEVSIDWPVRLDGRCPLQLMIFGRVIHSTAEKSTLKIARYEFRTRSLRSPRPAESPGKQRGLDTRDGHRIGAAQRYL